ncbi:hypothetical protein B0J11DRAFT_326747 [Dendryphion nanum]|uniref:Uncharacterized protein n=1 Tax=Dendryphion nanum TaxID=256645 RepID=A0A9P9DNM3_9PLEO|nr:hypothetical protein B0J11DRAFT_326747 [Dendryphion nanum]
MGSSLLHKRECVQYLDGEIVCYREGWWYSDTGIIVKWCILGAIFLFFTLWFVGGYFHAKSRMRKGLPLMGYHRFLIPFSRRRAAGQVPQNHFTFYATQQAPYGQNSNNNNTNYYQQRPDGSYPDAPPMYSNEAPPGYMPPPGATKTNWTQGPNHGNGMEMPPYPGPQGQQSGVVGGGRRDEEQGFGQGPQSQGQSQGQSPELPDRPQQAKVAIRNLMGRFRR